MSTDATIFPAAAETGPDQAVPAHAEAGGQEEGANPLGEPDTAEEIEARALRIVEALLFAASEPVTGAALAQHLPEGIDVGALLDRLAAMYQGRGVSLTQVAGGYAFRTAPGLARHLTIYRSVTRRFSRAALEALAIIAYHQPITRAEIETIRGVSLSRGTLDQLLEADWIKPKGRRAVPGRPATWVTTPEFLSHFGLDSLDDLPGVEELRASGLLEPVTAGLPSDDVADEDDGDDDQGDDEADEEPMSDA